MMNLDAFTLVELTHAINRFPMVYGRVNQMGLFPEQSMTTRVALIDEREGELNLIPAHEWGGPGTWADRDQRSTRTVAVPQTVHNDNILPDDIQGVRAFGQESALQPIASELAERIQKMRRRHDITLEWRRMGALRGAVLNADGTDVMLDLFAELAPAGVVQKVTDFAFTTPATKVRPLCIEVIANIEDALNGDTYSGVHALCSPSFFAALIDHDDVTKTYLNHAAAVDQRGSDLRRGFRYGDIVFEEYRGKVTKPNVAPPGNVLNFVPTDEAIAFPLGTQATFSTLVAPADFNETVNTRGRMYYAKTTPKEDDRGFKLHTQSNNLPICIKPAVLQKLTMS